MSQQSLANLAAPLKDPGRREGDSGGRVIEFPRTFPRSPLRYPGGKNRAVKSIYPLIPDHEKKLFSPFLGGGSIELACTTKMEVSAADIFEPLIAFWRVLLREPEKLAERVAVHYRLTRTEFYALQKRFVTLDDEVERAAAFFVLNRSSFSGTTLSGGMSPDHPRFTPSAIERIRNFRVQNFHVEHAGFQETIPNHADAFLYLDPPYLTKQGLYGVRGDTHRTFDHKMLADIMRERDRWIMSYNDCDEVRNLYKGYRILPIEWVYGMTKDKQSKEILILSPDVEVAA
jgi:DNA adenine methylase